MYNDFCYTGGKHSSEIFILFPKVTINNWWTRQITFPLVLQNSSRVTIPGYCHHNCIIQPFSARKVLRLSVLYLIIKRQRY